MTEYFRPMVVYDNPDEDRSDSFIKYFANRVINNNKNFLCAVTGKTGAGKSWLTGAIGEKYAKMTGMMYNPRVHTIFSLKELVDLVNQPNIEEILPPGTFIHFDEPQVSANARDWQSESNRILNTLTSTFRNMRLIIFFATPYLEFIDKQSRILFHAEIEVNGFDKTTNLTKCKPKLIEWVPKYQEFFKKRLIIKYKEKTKRVYSSYFLNDWEVYRPTKNWIDVYEPYKKEFTMKLNAELANRMNPKSKDSKAGAIDNSKAFDEVLKIYSEEGYNFAKFSKLYPSFSLLTIERLFGMAKKYKQNEVQVPNLPLLSLKEA